MKKILTIIGARPQFIKAVVVSRAFEIYEPAICEILVHTGQHYDANMSDVFFDQLKIPKPKYNLGIGGGTHGQNTGRMIERLEELMLLEKPDCVLVYGDTDSTLAGALAAVKLHIPIAHVEAGLRSFNRQMPEEINRILTDHVSKFLFTPNKSASINLLNEGISEKNISMVGDVMYDALLNYQNIACEPDWFKDLCISTHEFILCTIHRAENTNDRARMQRIFLGLANSNIPVILPLHPRTKNKIFQMQLDLPESIKVVDPVGYLEMMWLERNCKLIVTDSGGVQKEAYFNKKPCVTLREETEWTELVDEKVNELVGTNADAIKIAINRANFPSKNTKLFGNGNAAEQIVKILSNFKK